MKKLLFLSILPILSLAGCGPQKDAVADSPKESVILSAENFSTYVAINTIATQANPDYNDVVFYSYFIGADYCKFVGCTVTYTYEMPGLSSSTSYTSSLTLSGDGQAKPFVVRNLSRGSTAEIKIMSAKGTVYVYR